ncbi:hypothetical protein C7R93_09360 [Brevibacillus fortis]|uniref:Uncharacterized protein n=1 Tax=Brevibacillus fortis TaxID=2126352 RepID=A0A2P7VDN1_9BACL|nr:hypothetical protein C7R93_09360 [Brevibacillus fortis]
MITADHAVQAEVKLFEKLLLDQDIPKEDGEDWADKINLDSLIYRRMLSLSLLLSMPYRNRNSNSSDMAFFA